MSTDKSEKKKSSSLTWVVIALVVLVFVGARQLHPGGIRGLIADFTTESSTDPQVKELSDKMLASLIPIGAVAVCLKEQGDNAELEDAAAKFNSRNQAEMQRLVVEIKAAGGMSNDEKDLLDRKAYHAVRRLIGQGPDAERACNSLAGRINSGEFDL